MKDLNIVWFIVQIAILAMAWLGGRYGKNFVTEETIQDAYTKLEMICKFAEKFVSSARYFMSKDSGSAKMQWVVGELTKIAEQYGIELDEEALKAIAQKAYDSMKAGEQNQPIPIVGALVTSETTNTAVTLPEITKTAE